MFTIRNRAPGSPATHSHQETGGDRGSRCRKDEDAQLLVNDRLRVAYRITAGVPDLNPRRARRLPPEAT